MSASPPPVPRDVPEVQPDGRALRNWMNDLLRFLGSSGGTGTVTEIDTAAPITGGPITTSGTIAVSTMTGDSGAGGARGVVPAPSAGDAAAGKFLKADGTWTAPSGGATITTQDEGTPLSSTVTTLNFVGAGVTAAGGGATTTVTIPQGVTSVGSADGSVTVTNPTTTPDLAVHVTGIAAPVQSQLALKSICEYRWSNTGALDKMGFSAPSINGTLGASSQAITNPLTVMRRSTYTSAASIGASTGVLSGSPTFLRSAASWYGGFLCFWAFGFPQFNADSRFAVGITGNGGFVGTGATDLSASSGNWLMLGLDAADTGWQMIARDGTTTSAKTALGANFPRPLTSDIFFLWLYCTPNSSSIDVRMDRKTSGGDFSFTTTTSANLPNATTAFLQMQCACGTGPTLTTAAKVDISRMYLETLP